jgi:hypothetical protein
MILEMWRKFVYNFNPSNKYDVQWDNLKSKLKNIYENSWKNGWEKLFPNEIISNVINPHKNILLTNTKNVEPYDLSYENFAHPINA